MCNYICSLLCAISNATLSFYNPATSLNISKIVERVDECHTAIKTTLAVAQIGRPFADDVAALCDTLSRNIESQHLDELLSKLIATAEKGYGRSIQAHGQLICVRYGLSQVSFIRPIIQLAVLYLQSDIRGHPIASYQDSRRDQRRKRIYRPRFQWPQYLLPHDHESDNQSDNHERGRNGHLESPSGFPCMSVKICNMTLDDKLIMMITQIYPATIEHSRMSSLNSTPSPRIFCCSPSKLADVPNGGVR